MKVIMMSIRPQHTCNILNLIKLWEIRKKFPKDYVGWVYIYCTKEQEIFYRIENGKRIYSVHKNRSKCVYKGRLSNGVVVARFWCDKVEEIEHRLLERHYTATLGDKELLIESCLSHEEIHDYLRTNIGYAIHITNLEIFDKPKELSEFKRYINDNDCKKCAYGSRCPLYPCDKIPLTRAPQSWCYVEV